MKPNMINTYPYSEESIIQLLRYEWNKIIIRPTVAEHPIVMRSAVDSNDLTCFVSSLCSATYFVIPLLIPPLDNDITIEEKLFNCPTKATPAGPIIDATTFTLINPVNIFTKVDIAVNEKTFTISALAVRLHKEISFITSLSTYSTVQLPFSLLPPSLPGSSASSLLHRVSVPLSEMKVCSIPYSTSAYGEVSDNE